MHQCREDAGEALGRKATSHGSGCNDIQSIRKQISSNSSNVLYGKPSASMNATVVEEFYTGSELQARMKVFLSAIFFFHGIME